jgi:energy-converting hydrogenase Eha subunit C
MIIDPKGLLLFGVISFVIHRLILIVYLIRLDKIKDFIPILIAFVPFIFIFSYLISISVEIPDSSYYYLVIQNILVSIIGGIVLSNYFMNETQYTPWLSIFGLLSVGLYFIVFIEKWFLASFTATYFRPLGMILFAMAYFSFYKYVIDSERSTAKLK